MADRTRSRFTVLPMRAHRITHGHMVSGQPDPGIGQGECTVGECEGSLITGACRFQIANLPTEASPRRQGK